MISKLFFATLLVWTLNISDSNAQMFYSSSFDSAPSAQQTPAKNKPKAPEHDEDPETEHVPSPIKERLRNDALRIVVKPDEVLCYGISRKKPKDKTDTISGYALNGECGTLNEEGLAAVQEKFLNLASFDMTTPKISSSCVIKPRLLLRFHRGVDFVDVVLSGEKCPGILYLYGGETKEFLAKPMNEWLDTFISAVSNDIVPISEVTKKDDKQIFVRRKKADETEKPKEAAETAEETPAAQKTWGRRFN